MARAIQNKEVQSLNNNTYYSATPNHKTKTVFFVMMKDKVVVESFSGGAVRVRADDPEHKEQMEYLKKRFRGYIFRGDEVKTDPNKAKILEDKIMQIRKDVKNKKLADELIAALSRN